MLEVCVLPIQNKIRFSIRYKFLVLTSTLLVLSVLVHLWLATQIFKQDKTELIYDLNRSLVTNLKNELGNKIESNFGRMALAVLSSQGRAERSKKFSEKIDTYVGDEILSQDEDLVFVATQNPDGTLKSLYRNHSFGETYGISEDDIQASIQQMLKEQSALHEAELEQKIWPLSINQNVPLIGLSKHVVEEDSKGRRVSQYSVIGVMSLDGIAKSIQSARNSEITIFNSKGTKIFSAQGAQPQAEILNRILHSQVDTTVLSYQENGQDMLGAFAKGHGIVVAAKTNGDVVFAVVGQLIKRSTLFGVIVICCAFLLILLVSRSITSPLDMLIAGMEKVSAGDLDHNVNIKSNDEISLLSRSFNKMTKELRISRLQLENINRDLEKKVTDRTRKLEEQNRAVKEAQEALIRTTRLASVGEIAGRAAHEVLNPLTGILTRLDKVQRRLQDGIKAELQLLTQLRTSWESDYVTGGFNKLVEVWKAKSTLNPDQSVWQEDMSVMSGIFSGINVNIENLLEDAKFLSSEGQRINRIVNQMRSLSHIKREKKTESVHEILGECVNVMSDLFDQDKIKVSKEYQAKLDFVKLNKDEFMQSITNLLRNSIHSIREEGRVSGQITIRTRNENNQIFIEIEDNGTGIQVADQNKLFTSHFSTKDPSEGTGLGLSISRRFIRGFGGELSLVRSQLHTNTVFGVVLPLETIQESKGYGT